MKDLFTIGEVANLFGLNIRTLRYYHDIGLLEPEYIDETTNYRYYSTRQFERLNTIKYLRALDISTQQIGEFLRHRDVDVMLSILMEQQQEVQRKKEELELIEKKISNRLKQIDDALHSNCEEIVVKTFPPRHLVMLKKEIAMSEDLEYPIRDLERTHHLMPPSSSVRASPSAGSTPVPRYGAHPPFRCWRKATPTTAPGKSCHRAATPPSASREPTRKPPDITTGCWNI
ncbi:MAG: MerR family transcriptional regulator [Hungatella hathewayi]